MEYFFGILYPSCLVTPNFQAWKMFRKDKASLIASAKTQSLSEFTSSNNDHSKVRLNYIIPAKFLGFP